MGLYCEIPGYIERTISKEGDRRLPFVTVATFGGGSILRAKQNLFNVGIFIGGPGHSLHVLPGIFPYTS